MIIMKKGYKLSEETKKKMSISRRGKGNSFYGKKHSAETKYQISKSRSGIPAWNKGIGCREETKEKLSKVLKGRSANITSFKNGHVPWHKGKKGVYSEEILKQMSEIKKGVPAWNKGKHWSEEVKLKMSKSHKGLLTKDKHPNWQGGITKINLQIRNSFKYSEWRKEIFERDNYTCYKCGTRIGPLNVHHIIKFSSILKKYKIKTIDDAFDCNELWALNNGITLCKMCHKKIHKRTTTPKVKGWRVLFE